MPDDLGYVTPHQIISYVAELGLEVTRHQLRRWHKKDLLPRPHRHPKGRGQGTEARYPAYTTTQTHAILLLKRDFPRDLDSVGWYLWVLGFPVTDFARQLLLRELRESEKNLKREYSRLRQGISDTFLTRAAGPRALPGTEGMRQAVRRKRLPKVLRMIAEMELGILAQQEEYDAEDWQLLQDAVIAQLWPQIQDDSELPFPEEVEVGLKRLSEETSLPRVIEALEMIDDVTLCVFRNEAQRLFEVVHEWLGYEVALIPRERFLTYFKSRFLDRQSAAQLVDLIKALAWTQPPEAPITRLLTSVGTDNNPDTQIRNPQGVQ